MNYSYEISYEIDLNRDYPYIQETNIRSEKKITWPLEEILLKKDEIVVSYQASWNRVREWLKENHPELML